MDRRVSIRRISNGTELKISKASQLHDEGDYTCALSAPNSTLIHHTVEVAPKTTPAPQLKPTTTPEAEDTSTADADADADALAEVFQRVNIGGDKQAGQPLLQMNVTEITGSGSKKASDSPLNDLGAQMEKRDSPRINLKQEVDNGSGLCSIGASSTLLMMLSFFLYTCTA